jgi:hypothetical protein
MKLGFERYRAKVIELGNKQQLKMIAQAFKPKNKQYTQRGLKVLKSKKAIRKSRTPRSMRGQPIHEGMSKADMGGGFGRERDLPRRMRGRLAARHTKKVRSSAEGPDFYKAKRVRG